MVEDNKKLKKVYSDWLNNVTNSIRLLYKYTIGDQKDTLHKHEENNIILSYAGYVSFTDNGVKISVYILHNDKKVELLDEIFYEYATIPCFDPHKIHLLKGLVKYTKKEISFGWIEKDPEKRQTPWYPVNTLTVNIEDIGK